MAKPSRDSIAMGEKKRLWITRRLSDKTLERAQQYYDCEINFEDRVYSQDELIGLLVCTYSRQARTRRIRYSQNKNNDAAITLWEMRDADS